jgi:mono/diheme cytochrome c family protein
VQRVPARNAQGETVEREIHYPAMLAPPAGTVPRQAPAATPALRADDWAGAKRLVNPLAASASVLRQGQRDYLVHCASCHGRDGNAAGAAMAPYFAGIPSLNGVGMLNWTDGEVYHLIGVGRGRMPHLRAQLPPERRWAVAHFLRVQARANAVHTDLKAMLDEFDRQAATKPGDPARRAALVAQLAQAEADLKALATAGDGHAFQPRAEPLPEYVGPSWPNPEITK